SLTGTSGGHPCGSRCAAQTERRPPPGTSTHCSSHGLWQKSHAARLIPRLFQYAQVLGSSGTGSGGVEFGTCQPQGQRSTPGARSESQTGQVVGPGASFLAKGQRMAALIGCS